MLSYRLANHSNRQLDKIRNSRWRSFDSSLATEWCQRHLPEQIFRDLQCVACGQPSEMKDDQGGCANSIFNVSGLTSARTTGKWCETWETDILSIHSSRQILTTDDISLLIAKTCSVPVIHRYEVRTASAKPIPSSAGQLYSSDHSKCKQHDFGNESSLC